MKLAPFRPIDGIVAAVCGLVAVLLFFSTRFDRKAGTEAVIETANGDRRTVSLAQNTSFAVDGRDGYTLTVEIQNGAVRVIHSTCPDHLCEQGGWFSDNGRSAVCVPAGISVRVTGDGQTVDGVTG